MIRKYVYTTLIIVICITTIHSQSIDYNYTVTKTYTNENGTNSLDVIDYYSGFGNPVQQVERKVSVQQNDLVTLWEYDSFGRNINKWLPALHPTGGNYTLANTIKTNASATNNGDNCPFSVFEYDKSPLNRLINQTGPGEEWHAIHKSIKTQSLTNRSRMNTYITDYIYEKDMSTSSYGEVDVNLGIVDQWNCNYALELKMSYGQNVCILKMKTLLPYKTLIGVGHGVSDLNIICTNLDTNNSFTVRNGERIVYEPGDYLVRINYRGTTSGTFINNTYVYFDFENPKGRKDIESPYGMINYDWGFLNQYINDEYQCIKECLPGEEGTASFKIKTYAPYNISMEAGLSSGTDIETYTSDLRCINLKNGEEKIFGNRDEHFLEPGEYIFFTHYHNEKNQPTQCCIRLNYSYPGNERNIESPYGIIDYNYGAIYRVEENWQEKLKECDAGEEGVASIKVTIAQKYYTTIDFYLLAGNSRGGTIKSIKAINLKTGKEMPLSNNQLGLFEAGEYIIQANYHNTTNQTMDCYVNFKATNPDNKEGKVIIPLPNPLDVLIETNETTTLRCNHYKVITAEMLVLQKIGEYNDGELFVVKTTDEDNNVYYQFTDKKGQIVLSRQISDNELHDTYYIYDDLGNLCIVLPPIAIDVLENENPERWDESSQVLQQYTYMYKYDKRNRCIAKKIPGSQWIYYIYDKADRIIFTQDGEQRKENIWLFTIPDAYGRIVLTGTTTQNFDYTIPPLENVSVKAIWSGTTNTCMGYITSGVTLNDPVIYIAEYYDNYDYRVLSGFSDSHLIYNENTESEFRKRYGNDSDVYKHKGLLTGTAVLKLDKEDNNTYLYSRLYYDERKRLIQSRLTNHMGGVDEEYISYNFNGLPVRKIHQHNNGSDSIREEYNLAYDHANRLLEVRHKINGGETILLIENKYDDLGRLYSTERNENNALKTLYGYNVRSWIKEISTGSIFSQRMDYNPGGNIRQLSWANKGNERSYLFAYDGLSRLQEVTYSTQPVAGQKSYSSAYSSAYGTSITTSEGLEKEKYNTSYEYDKHGNILSLIRYGKLTETPSYGIVDNLKMSYLGNQLSRVVDKGEEATLSTSVDFKDFTEGQGEYLYNANGALVKDSHKGILNIQYNFLNLPQQMDIQSPVAEARNKYIYSAAGAKLKVVQQWNPNHSGSSIPTGTVNETLLSETKVTDYAGNKIYENGELKRVLVDGGYYDAKEQKYYFYLTDHLGSNRAVVDESGEVIQRTHYYPFGASFAEETGNEEQPYKYNGKELDIMHGLNLYDYSARYYEPATGRFTSPDPLAEKYYSISPYAYVANNPVKFIDPTGMEIDSMWINEWKDLRKSIWEKLNNLSQNNIDGINNGRISSLQQTLSTMNKAEKSTQLYTLQKSTGGLGELTYNPQKNAIVISYGSTANFVHEVTHVQQFENGDLAFSSISGSPIGADIFDEISAYQAQYQFDPSSVAGLHSTSTINNVNDITESWVKGLLGDTLYTPNGLARTGLVPLNINSRKIDFIKAWGIPLGIERTRDLAPLVPLKNYPGVHYKK